MVDFTDSPHNIVFEDIMYKRRHQNDFCWITRPFNPKSTYSHPHSSVNPLVYQYQVLVDKNIDLLMRGAFPNESSSHRFQRLNDMLKEIGCLKSINVVRWLGLFLLKIIKKVLQSVYINEARLLKIRAKMGKNPVVLVPTHRSYADFILMAFLCFNYDIEIPVVVAGMDFHAMFGMATLLRQCGAMYMRRSFKEDRIYGAVFKKYVQTVITESDSPFEFFIEGTRSRCGKSLMPKLGLLKMIVEVYLKSEVSDITFVPISINYDRLMEDMLYAREVIGIPKPKESTSGLLKGISLLEEQYGNIYINTGDEISLKEFHGSCETEILLPSLAQTIVRKQQDNTVITFFNIMSAVIINQLMQNKCDCIAVLVVLAEIAKLKHILTAVGAYLNSNDDDCAEITRCLNIHKFVAQKQDDGSIYLPNTKNNVTMPKDVLNTALTLIQLQHYSNPCYHFVTSPAILIIILSIEKHLDKGTLFMKYGLFRVLFKHEFLFCESSAQQDFERACNVLQKIGSIQRQTDGSFKLDDDAHNENLWFNLMLPYLKGYLFVCLSLCQLTAKPNTFNQSKLTTRIRKQLELELEVSNEMSLFYALSSHFISCTLASLLEAEVIICKQSLGYFIPNSKNLDNVISFLRYMLQTSDNLTALPILPAISKL